MSELYFNSASPFTRWIVANALLREKFVVVDVGCQGGVHPQWDLLGEYADVHAFDAIREFTDDLARRDARPNRHYYAMALGNEDGHRKFFVKPDLAASSFIAKDNRARYLPKGQDIVADPQSELTPNEGLRPGAREVDISRLDTLFANGQLPKCDFIKLDCEGFEPEVLAGAGEFMRMSSVLAVTSEASFQPSHFGTGTHFDCISSLLLKHHLRVFDLVSLRLPRPTYLALRKERNRDWYSGSNARDKPPPFDLGQPIIFDFLFCRDLVAEQDDVENNNASAQQPSVDRILKMMIIFELHGLMDCAVDLASRFRESLMSRLDVDRAIDLLLEPPPHARNLPEIVDCLGTIAALRSALDEAKL
jgi:FkbM family methyltransferase